MTIPIRPILPFPPSLLSLLSAASMPGRSGAQQGLVRPRFDEVLRETARPEARPHAERSREDAKGDDAPGKETQTVRMPPPPDAPALRHVVADAPAATASVPRVLPSLEELLPMLVRRVAWRGDKHNASVHLSLGAGAYEGTNVLIHSDGAGVSVELTGTESPQLENFRKKLEERLRAKGITVGTIT